MKYKYVVFDFNGTILNDVELCHNLLNEMLEMKGLKTISRERYKEIFTFPIIEYYKRAGFDFSNYSFEDLAQYFIDKYQPLSLKIQIDNKLIQLFEYLKQHRIKMIVLSASKRDNLIEQLNHFNLSLYFEDILGISDIYAREKIDIAKDYFNKMKINPSDVLFIGDTLHDLEIANYFNSDCILVNFGHQDEKLFLNTNAKVISSFDEVKNLL